MKNLEIILKELLAAGFDIEKVNDNEYICQDNGRFGFVSDEEPFVVDAEELLEIHEQYIA